MTAHRVVSLIASATEIVATLGYEDRLVGRSHECDFPPSVDRLPVCSEARIDTDGTSRQIDERVKAVLTDALSVYSVFTQELERLRPTLIITQTQCEVCAVSLKDVERAVAELVDSDPQIVPLEPMSLADVWSDIRRVAGALGDPDRGEMLVAELQQRLHALEQAAGGLPDRPTIACIEWIDPLMAAGNWVPELVELAGGSCLLGRAGRHSPWMQFDELKSVEADVIAVMPCGFDISKTRREMPALARQPGWNQLKAVQNNRVFLVDGNQYMNRPGPRLVESAEILAEILHPKSFDFAHRSTGWEPY